MASLCRGIDRSRARTWKRASEEGRLWAARLALLAATASSVACSSSSRPVPLSDGSADMASRDVVAAEAISDSGVDVRDATLPEDASAPYLTALEVTATTDSGTPVLLTPAFSSETHDYYVRCAAGSNAFTVSFAASKGASGLLVRPTVSAALPTQTLAVTVTEGDAVVAVATDAATSTEYWVRCLPHDFPHLQMTAHPDAGTPPPGYYLVGNWLMLAGEGGYAMVLDGQGVPVWYLRQTSPVHNVDSLVPGVVSFAAGTFWGPPFVLHTLSPPNTSLLGTTGAALDSHELRRLPNGNYLAFAVFDAPGMDLTGLSVPLPDGGTLPLGPDASMVNEKIIEIDPAGKVVWTWFATDHLDPQKESVEPNFASNHTLIEVFHGNSIDVDPENGNLLVSFRYMNTVVYVDRENDSGTILWKLGGTPYSKDNPTYVPLADPFYGQHDARLVSWSQACQGGTGKVSVFDDHTYEAGLARGVVYDVVVGAGEGGVADGGIDCGAVAGSSSATVTWQYHGTTNALALGSFRIAPDGGTRVIGWGDVNPTGRVFTEVDESGQDLLDFDFTDGNGSYRAIKVPLSEFDLEVLRNTAGLP